MLLLSTARPLGTYSTSMVAQSGWPVIGQRHVNSRQSRRTRVTPGATANVSRLRSATASGLPSFVMMSVLAANGFSFDERIRWRLGIVCLVAYVATIYAANWAIERYGPVSVGFGLTAPAGLYFAGLAFPLRDLTQATLGRRAVVAAILLGAALSSAISTSFALASGVAFLVSELADLAVYTPLERRNWLLAVLCSNTVGLVVDSVLFLWIAFGSLEFLKGQIVGKAWVT